MTDHKDCRMCGRTIFAASAPDYCTTCGPKVKRKRRVRSVDRTACEKVQTKIQLTGSMESQRLYWWNMEQVKAQNDAIGRPNGSAQS